MSTESLSSNPEEIDVIKDILQSYNNEIYLNKLQELDLDPRKNNWRLLVELNARLSEYSINSWYYKFILQEKEEILFPPGSYYKSGKKMGEKKPNTVKNLLKIYNNYLDPGEAVKTRNSYLNVELLAKEVARRIVERKYKDFIVIPDLDSLREFLSIHKTEINELISAIPDGNRGLLSYMDISEGYGNGPTGLNGDRAWEESDKFANPLYTVFGLSHRLRVIRTRGPYGWFKGKVPSPAALLGRWGGMTWGNIRIKTSSLTHDSIRDASVSLMKLLLEFIEPDILNSKACINTIIDIILNANKHYSYPQINYGIGPDDQENGQKDKILSVQLFKLLVQAGLSNQSISNLRFDVFGGTWMPMETHDIMFRRLILPSFIHPLDPYRGRFPTNLHQLIHLDLRNYWEETRKLFDKKKLLSFATGNTDEYSPLSLLDSDVFRKVGKQIPVGYMEHTPSRDALRRNAFARWSPQKNLVSAQQRLNTALGTISPDSLFKEGEIELINRIMKSQMGLDLIEQSKMSENKLITAIREPSPNMTIQDLEPEPEPEPEPYFEPEPEPEPIGGVFNPGDKVSYTSKKGVPYTGKVLENRGKQLLVKKDKGGKALVPVLDKTLKSLGKSGGKLKHRRSHRKRRK
tara:strand:+ start:1154 stop:3049 length:1896 start_codon:yes stop_codon:yes gene_type:complete